MASTTPQAPGRHAQTVSQRHCHLREFYNGNAADSFRVTGTAGNATWQVRYYDYASGTDITGAMTGAGWTTASTGPGAYRRVRLEVTPLAGAAASSTVSALLTATSMADTSKKDAAKAVTTCALARKPDGIINNGSACIGDGVYNTSRSADALPAAPALGRLSQ